MTTSVDAELKDILAQYNLGELDDYEKNERGFVNTAFAVITLLDGERRRYFLRKYKRGIREEELQFEHSLVAHLEQVGTPVAHIHLTRAGKSYLHRFEGPQDTQGVFYTLFDYLPGEDRFTWIDPLLNDAELTASAQILAQFHAAVDGFSPRGRRAEPKIIALLPVIAETWAACPAQSKGTVFDASVMAHFDLIGRSLAETMAALAEDAARSLPEVVIHCDFHPGNLKFSGQTVTGLFDFDWSKVDFRAFDLALALWYFCVSWQPGDDGRLRLEWARTFLQAYRQSLAKLPGARVLSQEEVQYLPALLNAANLYVLNWTILDFYAKDVDAQEYIAFLEHSIRFTLWMEQADHRRELEEMLAGG
jgi:homoserine kinase type II